jgi:ribosomal protein S18 acetylase RimI-like enzyme
MSQVADLIEMAFGGNLDPTGRRMVHEMRLLGRMGWLGWLTSRLLLPPAARPKGFVWIDGKRVVGNASLLPVKHHPQRWVMANVAVHPDFRRRGIARAMVKACLGVVRARGAHTIVLQVERENQAAQILYASMGFRPLKTRANWKRPSGLELASGQQSAAIRPRRRDQWREQMELARQTFPEGVIWPYPLSPGIYRGKRNTRHWLYWSENKLLGSLTAREGSVLRLILVVLPEVQGQIELDLLRYGLQQMGAEKPAILIDYPVDVVDDGLAVLGFRRRRALTWMRKRLVD